MVTVIHFRISSYLLSRKLTIKVHVIFQAISRKRTGFHPRPGHVIWNWVDRVALVWVFSEYLGFSANTPSTHCAVFINHPVIDSV